LRRNRKTPSSAWLFLSLQNCRQQRGPWTHRQRCRRPSKEQPDISYAYSFTATRQPLEVQIPGRESKRQKLLIRTLCLQLTGLYVTIVRRNTNLMQCGRSQKYASNHQGGWKRRSRMGNHFSNRHSPNSNSMVSADRTEPNHFRSHRKSLTAANTAPAQAEDQAQGYYGPVNFAAAWMGKSTSRRQKLYSFSLPNCSVHLICGHEDDHLTRYKAAAVRDHREGGSGNVVGNV